MIGKNGQNYLDNLSKAILDIVNLINDGEMKKTRREPDEPKQKCSDSSLKDGDKPPESSVNL